MTNALGLLQTTFENFADGRRRRAREHPNDAARNKDAASVLDKLAATVKDVHSDYANAYTELRDSDAYDAVELIEIEQEMIKAAGFHRWWRSAEDFVKEVIARMTGGGR